MTLVIGMILDALFGEPKWLWARVPHPAVLMGRLIGSIDMHMQGREYLAGDFTAADTITGHACLMSERMGVDLIGMNHLTAYLERLKARPAMQKAFAA